MSRTPYAVLTALNIALMSAALALCLLDSEPSDLTVFMTVIYAATLVAALLSLYLARRRVRKTLALLNERCDPDAYLLKTQKLFDRAMRWDTMSEVLTQRLNLSAGLSAAGRYQEALFALPDHNLFPNDRQGKMQQAVCHNNGFAALIKLGLQDPARQALTMMYGAIEGVRPGKAQARLSRLYRLNYAEYAMAEGRFDGAEEAFREASDKAENTCGRVSAMFDLGRIHAHFGRTDEARAAFEYVIAHGNKLHMVSVAREQLDALALRLPPP